MHDLVKHHLFHDGPFDIRKMLAIWWVTFWRGLGYTLVLCLPISLIAGAISIFVTLNPHFNNLPASQGSALRHYGILAGQGLVMLGCFFAYLLAVRPSFNHGYRNFMLSVEDSRGIWQKPTCRQAFFINLALLIPVLTVKVLVFLVECALLLGGLAKLLLVVSLVDLALWLFLIPFSIRYAIYFPYYIGFRPVITPTEPVK